MFIKMGACGGRNMALSGGKMRVPMMVQCG